ncbi:hypothetical protein EI94DRAFT_1798666 [Lactarius quietus]|nr:hypothetical protein EI94DRAFT_1798666 [Lactarius quietus]
MTSRSGKPTPERVAPQSSSSANPFIKTPVNTSSCGAYDRWNSAGANGGGSELSSAASDVGLDPTQVYYVISYSGAELRTVRCERVRKMPLSGLNPNVSILECLPSLADVDECLEAMSDPDEEEDGMLDDEDSPRSGVGDANVETREEVEDSSDDFFRFWRWRRTSESGQSGAGTEDDPVAPVTPSAAPSSTISQQQRKATAADVDLSRTRSSDSADLDDEEWVDPTPIPPTPHELSPPAFPPPIIAKSKSSSSTKSRKRKDYRAHVSFPSSVVEGASEDRPRRVPQMSMVRGWDGGRTQSRVVKSVIAPEVGSAEPDDLQDGDDF